MLDLKFETHNHSGESLVIIKQTKELLDQLEIGRPVDSRCE